MHDSEKFEAFRARMDNIPPVAAIDQVRQFLFTYVADGNSMDEVRAELDRMAKLNQSAVQHDADAIEALLSSRQPAGTLSWLVAYEGNQALEDGSSDASAAEWLSEMVELIHGVLAKSNDGEMS